MNHFHFSSATPLPTISFYEKYFGFRKVKMLGKTHVLVSQTKFILAIDEAMASEPIPASSHLGFSLPARIEVQSLYEKMTAENQTSTGALLEPSPRALHFYCSDPSGNRLEIGWYDLG